MAGISQSVLAQIAGGNVPDGYFANYSSGGVGDSTFSQPRTLETIAMAAGDGGYNHFDPTTGNFNTYDNTKTGTFSEFAQAAMMAAGLATGVGALGFGGAGLGAGAAGSIAGDAFLPGMLGAEGLGLGSAALPGLEGYLAAGATALPVASGSAVGNALPAAGDAFLPGALGVNGAAAPQGLAGLEGYLATGAGATSGVGAGASGGTPNSVAPSSLGSTGGNGFSLGSITKGLGSASSLLKGISGLTSSYQGMQDSNSGGNLGDMFGPDSAYAKQLRQQLERRDSASGRRSQYGPREVELQANLAKMYAGTQPAIQAQNQYRNQQRNQFLNGLGIFGEKSGLFGAMDSGLSRMFAQDNTQLPTGDFARMDRASGDDLSWFYGE